MDDLWCSHLENMNLLKESVSMEVFRGRNPLEEFGVQVRRFSLRAPTRPIFQGRSPKPNQKKALNYSTWYDLVGPSVLLLGVLIQLIPSPGRKSRACLAALCFLRYVLMLPLLLVLTFVMRDREILTGKKR